MVSTRMKNASWIWRVRSGAVDGPGVEECGEHREVEIRFADADFAAREAEDADDGESEDRADPEDGARRKRQLSASSRERSGRGRWWRR